MSVDWNKYRDLVLQRLRARYASFSETLRNMPTIVFQDPETMETLMLSPNDAIREVNNLSDLGKKYMTAEIRKLAQMQP